MIDFSISNKLTDDVTISNDLLLVLQQIDLLFDTDINTVWVQMNSVPTMTDTYTT